MTEGFKTFFPMIGSHTAVPDASEGEGGIGKMHDYIIDASSAETERPKYLLLVLLVVCKAI